MAQQAVSTSTTSWWEASGLRHLFRTPGMALHPGKLGIALGALIVTFLWGGFLDWMWVKARGGIESDAIAKYVAARQLDQPYVEGPGDFGPFALWRKHERACIEGFLVSALPLPGYFPAMPVGGYVMPRGLALEPVGCWGMSSGCWWLMRAHPFFFLLFGGGSLLVWSLAGGAICRIAAVQIARDEKITINQALAYGRKRLITGFLLAPCVPLAFALVTVILLVLGGMLLRVPGLGDIVCGLAFPLAIIGGFVVAILLVGLMVGGSLFWPAVAAEGSDGFDAFSRGLSYFLGRPWKSILYGVVLVILASICWIVANAFAIFALTITRGAVGWGAAWFGLWKRDPAIGTGSKLDLLWPAGPGLAYAWPSGPLSWYEYFSAACIAICVLMVVGLLWSFLASFYFSGSTIAYFLLRRDVDGTEMNEVLTDDPTLPESDIDRRSTSSKEVSLPVTNTPGDQ